MTKIAQEITKSKEIQDEEDFENAKKLSQKVKHKSMVVQKEEENIKNQILMIAKRNISSIGIFIKLVDYMVVETQVNIALESIQILFGEMNKSIEQKKYGIQTDVNFEGDGDSIGFNPQEIEF